MRISATIQNLRMILYSINICVFLLGCRFKTAFQETTEDSTIGAIPFSKASGENASGLAKVHAESFASAPAAVRPDPDLYARRLLKQFKSDGNTLARQLGLVEQYRLMLGGATDDFRTVPQESYDATSLLTLQTVAEEICTALVTPNSWSQPGWQTVLTEPPANVEANIRALMSKMLGLPNGGLSSTAVSELVEMVQLEAKNGVIENKNYVTACTAMAMDAEALLL